MLKALFHTSHTPFLSRFGRPVILQVWDVLKAGALAALGLKPPLVQAIIGEMVAARDASLRAGTDTPVFGMAFSAALGKVICS